MDTNDPGFVPPHCPNPNCRHHRRLPVDWRYKCIGTYGRQVRPHRIRRFLCLSCRRSFSTQTFSTTYWLKRPDILPQLVTKTTGAMANRQIARDLGIAPATVDLQLARLGRHCLLYHAEVMATAKPAPEIVIDGFVTFEHSQFWPFHHHLAVEKGTDFMIYFTDSEVRRSGHMTDAQKLKRQHLETTFGRPDPGAVRRDVHHLLEVASSGRREIVIHSDDHRAYPTAIKRLACDVTHIVTSSRERRDARNKLFEVNLADLMLRHGSANHRRETIAWSKRRQASAERLAIFLVWRNYLTGRRQKVRGSPTPAEVRGTMDHRVTREELLERRLFVDLVALPERWGIYYWRDIDTRVFARPRRHRLSYAR